MPVLTAGEECSAAAKILSAFTGTGASGSGIPKSFISMSMACAIFRGDVGVAVVRLKTGDWSAPCAIIIENPSGSIAPGQDTILLFMTERAVLGLVARTRLILNNTHRFAPGPLSGSPIIDGSIDVYAYVRFNSAFTPSNLISQNMTGWGVREDMDRHTRWHGADVTWADVLMNKISVDRSSIGNALYIVMNIAAGGNSQSVVELNGRKNFANLDLLPVRQGKDGPGPIPKLEEPNEFVQNPSTALVPITPAPVTAASPLINTFSTPDHSLELQQQQYLQQQQLLQQQQQQAAALAAAQQQQALWNQIQMAQQQQAFTPTVFGMPVTSFEQTTTSFNSTTVQTPTGSSNTTTNSHNAFGYQSPAFLQQQQNEHMSQQLQFKLQREQAEERARQLEQQSRLLEQQRLQLEQEQRQLAMGMGGIGMGGMGGMSGSGMGGMNGFSGAGTGQFF